MLPTIEEAQQFLAVVNAGREACGLERIEYLDFDNAEPSSSGNCLSARNLFAPLGSAEVNASGVVLTDADEDRDRLAEAIGAKTIYYGLVLPETILCVTNPFDYSEPGLRARLVEAGVVEDR